MKYKFFVIVATMVTITGFPAHAEIIEYKDDYVSFSYDDEMLGAIDSTISKNYLSYFLVSADKTVDGHAQCTISIHKKYDSFDKELYESLLEDSPSEYVIVRDDDSIFSYISWLSESNDDKINLWVDTFRESIDLHDDINSIDGQDEPDTTYIFTNYHYSDQVYVYAKKALEILTGYMDMTLQKEDAFKQINELYNRVESYVENSEYYFDSDLKNALYYADKNIESGDDGEITRAINDLQIILEKQ